MEYNRRQKLVYIFTLILAVVSLSVGFAAFSTTLNISSSASVTPTSDSFSVKFSTNRDSIVESNVVPSSNEYNLVTTNGVINNSVNPTISGLSAVFTEPGQVVSYTLYARNEGEYTAYLNNVNFIGNKTCVAGSGATDSLVQSACNDINVRVVVENNFYPETTEIIGHSLEKNEADTILIILDYGGNGTRVDGPFSIVFPNIALVYSTVDDSSIQPTLPEKVVRLESGTLDVPGSIVSIGSEQFYVIGQEDGNVKLLSMYNLYVGNYINEFDEMTAISDATGIQSSSAYGYWGCPPAVGVVQFGSNSVYENSLVSSYVNYYAAYLRGLGVIVNNARLITKDELLSFGIDDEWCYDGSGNLGWLIETTYWTQTAFDSNNVWYVDGYNMSIGTRHVTDTIPGVRPVIEIPLSEF